MINVDMRDYNYYLYGENNAYGQPQLSEEAQGTVKMAIYTVSQSIQDNILYQDCSYIGLTNDAEIDDKYVIQYDKERLKVLYVQPRGRFKQAFLARM